MNKRYLLATAAVLMLQSAELNAADLPAVAPITDVIVYPDRAEITRSVEIKVPRGANTVVIPGLPTDIVPQSIRVIGEADGTVQIATIETRVVRPEIAHFVPDPKIEAMIQALQGRKPPIEDRIAIAQMQIDYYKLLLEEAPQVSDKMLIKSLDPQQWDSVWTTIGAKLTQAQEVLRLSRAELRVIDDEILQQRQLQNPSQARPSEPPSLTARIGIDADAAATAHLRISYQLSGVSWQPSYDARLNSENGEVTLVQFGEIRQRTGEDWQAVSLVLSTARPALGAVLPGLTAWRLQSRDHGAKVYGLAEQDSGALREAMSGGFVQIDPSVTQLAATDFAAEYRVAGRVDLASGDGSQRIVIAEHKLESHLAARVVPKLTPHAHLYATAAYDGRDPLLPGPLTVFRDGAFLGGSTLPFLRPQEEFRLGFGADDKIRVDYRSIPIDPKSVGLFGDKQRIERQYVAKIANYHQQTLEITLLDQMPISSNEAITVELLGDTTPPSETEWDDQDGVLAWTGSYAPAEEKTINFGYAITYPQDMSIGVMMN